VDKVLLVTLNVPSLKMPPPNTLVFREKVLLVIVPSPAMAPPGTGSV
jgi:hypothetical protein